MLFLLLAITSSTLISILMRYSENYIKNQMAMFTTNYAICSALSLYYVQWGESGLLGNEPGTVLGIGLISGVLFLASFVFLKFNMEHNGIVLASTFMKLGVLIPTIMAVVVFGESLKWTRGLGIVLAVAAIVLIHFEKEGADGASSDSPGGGQEHSGRGQGSMKIWLIVLLIMGGFTDSMTNIYEKLGDPTGKDGYLFITFFVALVLAALAALLSKAPVSRADLLFGALIGIPNYFASRFLLLALGSVDAVLVYPMYSVGTLVVITLAGILLFKEEVSRKKACAMGLIVVALCLLNI